MKINVLSDLHISSHVRANAKDIEIYEVFKDVLSSDISVEVLCVPGDLGHDTKQSLYVLERIAVIFNFKHVIAVLGNHDLYNDNHNTSMKRFTEYVNYESEVVTILNGTTKTIDGVTFGGAMGWSYGTPYINKVLKFGWDKDKVLGFYSQTLNDAVWIDNLDDPEEMYLMELPKLKSVYKECDVMISHYPPAMNEALLAPEYRLEPTTGFFVMDCEDLVKDGSMQYWLAGHTHTKAHATIAGTDIIVNPFGYPNELRHSNPVILAIGE